MPGKPQGGQHSHYGGSAPSRVGGRHADAARAGQPVEDPTKQLQDRIAQAEADLKETGAKLKDAALRIEQLESENANLAQELDQLKSQTAAPAAPTPLAAADSKDGKQKK